MAEEAEKNITAAAKQPAMVRVATRDQPVVLGVETLRGVCTVLIATEYAGLDFQPVNKREHFISYY